MSEKCKYHKECSFPTLLYFYLVRKIMSVQGFFFVGFKKGENLKKVVKKVVLGLVSSVFVWGAASCTLFAADDDDSVAVQNSSSPAVELEKENKAEKKSEEKKKTSDDKNNTVTPGGTPATGVMDTPTVANVSNVTVNIVKSEGWLNSAYIVFEQVEGATYKVLCDDVELDAPLIRYYDEYTYYEQSENEELQVTWTKKTLSKVVRADALGLAAGSHTIKVCAVGTENSSEYSTATMKVVDHDRSGFAFAPSATTTPGAYKADGTLKDGAIVIYLTQGNKNTVTATIGGKTYTGIQDITQAIKTKNLSNPVDIRIIGTVTAESNDLSCADMKSAYAIGVKEASQVTIEGVGHDATLYSAGVAAFKSDYIEIANLGLMKWGGGKDGDGVSLKEGHYAWIHNCDYFYGNAGSDGDQVKGDGSMDLKDDQQYTTISYNHFWDSGKMSLCGMKDETGPNYITYHHNWFDHSDSRHPRIRKMTVHVYNNYFDGNAKYGVGVTTGSSCFVEQNFFRNAHDPMMSSKQGTDATGKGTFSGESGGVIKAYNNKFVQNNSYGVTFQYITNKYDYTNNKELGEYKEWYETVGTANSDGTWTIYDSKVSSTEDGFAKNSLIAIEDAVKKDSYYQISKEKSGFYIDVPANTTKIIVKAKCGSSNKSGKSNMLSVNGQKFEIDLAADYAEYEATVSLTADSTIEIANADKNCSMNIKEIKVIAASGWETKLTSGADLSNIDAYEVDNRSDQVPANVTAKSGGSQYSNFDVALGDSGMGVTIAVTDPDKAKANVLKYSGRHDSDYYYNFTNSVDDASYAKNDSLNSELVAYTGGMKAVQGYTQAASSGEGAGGGGNSGTGGSGETPAAEKVAVTGVSLSKTELTLTVGKNETITATIKPTNATTQDVTWATSDKTVATVDNKKGKISAVKAGKATITVTTKDGSFKAECVVTVEAAPGVTLWLNSGNTVGTCLNSKLTKIDSKFETHSDVDINLTSTDVVSSASIHACKLDSNGPNLFTKGSGEAGKVDPEGDYIKFTIAKDCTVQFTSSGVPASLRNSEGTEIETQSAIGDFSKSLSAGTYLIYGTKSSSACKIPSITFIE